MCNIGSLYAAGRPGQAGDDEIFLVMTGSRKICVGMLTGPHGVRGLVVLRSFTENPTDVTAYGPLSDEHGTRSFALEIKSALKDHFIAAIEGIGTREQAQALKGVKLYVPRAALPPPAVREYYDADLIGLRAVDAAGVAVGQVTAVHNYGAGPFLDLKLNDGDSLMLPFTDACVPVVDIDGGRITITPPTGWLDPAEPSTEDPTD